jgi:hypothetical protein
VAIVPGLGLIMLFAVWIGLRRRSEPVSG